ALRVVERAVGAGHHHDPDICRRTDPGVTGCHSPGSPSPGRRGPASHSAGTPGSHVPAGGRGPQYRVVAVELAVAAGLPTVAVRALPLHGRAGARVGDAGGARVG